MAEHAQAVAERGRVWGVTQFGHGIHHGLADIADFISSLEIADDRFRRLEISVRPVSLCSEEGFPKIKLSQSEDRLVERMQIHDDVFFPACTIFTVGKNDFTFMAYVAR